MHDTVIIHIPINKEFVKREGSLYSIIGEVAHYGVRAVSDIKYDLETDTMKVHSELKHPFESLVRYVEDAEEFENLPSSTQGMAMKFYSHRVANTLPYVALNASYKFIQGHNVYGGDYIAPLVAEMLRTLQHFYPNFYAFLDVQNASISRIDCTYSASLDNAALVPTVLKFLSNVSNGHRKKDTDRRDFYNTVYWGGRTSNWGNACAYGKHNEIMETVNELQKSANKGNLDAKKKLSTIFTPELQEFSSKLLRLEARTKKRTLEKLLIPTNVWDFIRYQDAHPYVLRRIWRYWFDPIFKAFKGEIMTTAVDDSKIRTLCREKLVTTTKSGKLSYTRAENAFSFYQLIKSNGWENMKQRFASNPRTFQINVKSLVDIGIPKAHLQNLVQDMGHEIPLIRIINVDFDNQCPQGYQPPKIVVDNIIEFVAINDKDINRKFTQLRLIA